MIMSYQVCKGCGVRYLEVDLLPYRMAGYCTEECLHHEPRGVPSAESIGWKEKIAEPSQRRRFSLLPPSTESSRQWVFDMVHYPRPLGWQIENWRMVDTSAQISMLLPEKNLGNEILQKDSSNDRT